MFSIMEIQSLMAINFKDLYSLFLAVQVLTRSWVRIVLRECIMSECWEARSSRSLMGTAPHAATMYNTVERGSMRAVVSRLFSHQPKLFVKPKRS